MSHSEALVLPGVGSPESPLYHDVYNLLAEGASDRSMTFRCLKYKGHGHLADGSIEGQIDLPGVAEGIADEVGRAKPGGILICRSFGCLLPGYLALNHGVVPGKFRRIAFWGPVPSFELWNLFGTSTRVAEKSAEAERKGARVAPDFYESMLPLEVSCKALLGTELVLGVGTCDKHTTPAFANYLAATVRDAGNPNVRVQVVDGAPHEVTSALDQGIRRAYLDALLG